ncbi:hypothetical protein [Simkania sp.]|uniref:hypothetical protein n=1 Tax=Simkania sp. TaxID=34094 RepID=UPI003B527855
MTQIVSNFIKTNSYSTLAASSLCAVTACEMAIRTIGDLGNKISGSKHEDLDWNLSANLGGAIFYSLCAANLVPGSAKIGALSFSFYSITDFSHCPDRYLTSRIIDNIFKEALLPIIERVSELTSLILSRIPLPVTPVWWAIAALSTAILIYHSPLLEQAKSLTCVG